MEVKISPENLSFTDKVKLLTGEDIDLCYQCGVCSSSCPMSSEMDVLPSTIMRFIQLGIEDVLKSEAIWMCNSCFTCQARCPRGIDLAKIMEALRQLNLRKGLDYVKFSNISKNELRRLPQIALVSNFRKFTS